ncbi:GNAT family N-acetyltransferase [Actinoplanes sp. NPDC049548]|uniref:GNAT family N-acetyltransferase n=1 Tax=Actinoplanes sp. NPDC049548 TaxID=3155152 RepID=UPI0034458E90
MTRIEERARALWAGLAGVPVYFTPGEVTVVTAPASELCPPGWAGIVALGDAAIATLPAPAESVAEALRRIPVAEIADPDRVRRELPVEEILGPAVLAYLDVSAFRPASGPPAERLPAGHRDVRALIAGVPASDAGESGLDDIDSAAFVVRAPGGGRVIAAAGYRRWPSRVAHLSVLTATGARGRGDGRAAASAAVRDALAQGLLPQWRARPAASRRVAAALGFRDLGSQLSIRLAG